MVMFLVHGKFHISTGGTRFLPSLVFQKKSLTSLRLDKIEQTDTNHNTFLGFGWVSQSILERVGFPNMLRICYMRIRLHFGNLAFSKGETGVLRIATLQLTKPSVVWVKDRRASSFS